MHQFKKAVSRLTASLLLVSTLVVPAFAVTGTVNSGGGSLNVRAESSTSSKILTKLSTGTQVEVIGKTENGWYQIMHNDVIGYVSDDYLSVTETAELSTVSDPVYGRVNTSILNLRSAPTTNSSKVGYVSGNSIVTIYSKTATNWYHIDGGYVSADYVTIMDTEEAKAELAKIEAEKAAQASRSAATTSTRSVSSASEAVVSVPAATDTGAAIANYALQFVGCRYVYGGTSPNGFDCSGLTYYVARQFGISINRSSSGQLNNGVAVTRAQLQPGDLVLFRQYGSTKAASHVGIYIGNNQFVHASAPGVGVIVSSLDHPSYGSGFLGGRRIA